MDWTSFIDNYCERTAPGLFNEPLNALSNLAFFLAALWAGRRALIAHVDWAVWALIAMVAVVGAGSLAFHSFATRGAMLADVIPIAVFIYSYLGLALHRFLGLNYAVALALVMLLLIVNLSLERFLPLGFLNGSAAYLPSLLAGLAVAAAANRGKNEVSGFLLAASLVFALSLVFRTADQAICPVLPTGTHYVWHVLNAVVLGLYLDAAIRFGKRGPKMN
jgi:Ceramidase